MADFDERLKERAAVEACSVPAGFDQRVAQVLDSLPGQDVMPVRRSGGVPRWVRSALLAAAVGVILCASALALSPALRDMLAQAMGTYAPYSQELSGVSAVDQGLKITVQSAVVDRNAGLIYLTVQDLIGDRLQEGAEAIAADVQRGDSWSYGSGRYVSYDPETKTALYQIRYTDQNFLASQERDLSVQLEIGSVGVGSFYLDHVPLPQELLTKQTLKTQVLETGQRVLVPEQTPAELKGAWGLAISSLGFDEEGRLHVQTKFPAGAVNRRDGMILTNIRSKSGSMENEDRYNDGRAYVAFEQDGTLYEDRVCSATPADFDDIKLDTLYGPFSTAPEIDGSWVLTTPLTDLPERDVTADEKLGRDTVKHIYLTALSATILSESADHPTEKNMWSSYLTVFLRDGSSFTLEGNGKSYGENLGNDEVGWYSTWVFDEAVEPDEVVGIAIGQRYLPLDGGEAGEGSWLPEQPQPK